MNDLTKSEREYTDTYGIIAKKLIESGLIWIRFADSGRRSFNKYGCDGLIWLFPDHCCHVEVKKSKAKFEQNEILLATWLKKRNIPYYVIRIFPDKFQVTLLWVTSGDVAEIVPINDEWTERITKALNETTQDK